MTLLLIAGVAAGALALILWGIVPLVARPATLEALGPFRAGLLGIVICGVIAVLGFGLADLDHIALTENPRARFWEAVQLAGASAILWLPVYLFAFSRARRREPL
ncbi:MAG: hypothetical protein LW703_10195 [Rhodobacter sp.]|nr:hypothetical protein [Rhodobacter sp.]